MKKAAGKDLLKDQTFDVVEFELGGERYAMDIGFAREIVEMMPITPIPRAPHYLCGVMNLRGEITNILDINSILGIPEEKIRESRKIIVLSQEASEGENMGIVVDDVQSVLQVRESQIEKLGDSVTGRDSSQIKGVIKIREPAGPEKGEGTLETVDLVIWIDIKGIIRELTTGSRN
ncbi:MAG: chemotaxis protein CheW [Methanoregulaceae archaeon]|nr:chemotaxis protein CheW [Methanoregulaceae archaeon]